MRFYEAGELITNINGESYYFIGKNLNNGMEYVVGRNTMIRDPKVNIRVNKNFDLIPTLVKYFLCEQLGTTNLSTDMTNLYKSFIGSNETNIVIDFSELKAKKMTKWVIDSANTSAETGLHRNTFNQFKITSTDALEAKITKLYIEIAALIYSSLWEIHKDMVMDAIMEISKFYSKGSFYGTDELEADILKSTERLLGCEPKIIISEYKVKEITNLLFEKAMKKYKEHIQNKEHSCAEYFAFETAIYSIVFHVWNGGSFADTHNLIHETVIHFSNQKVIHNNGEFLYLEHYIHKTKGEKHVHNKPKVS